MKRTLEQFNQDLIKAGIDDVIYANCSDVRKDSSEADLIRDIAGLQGHESISGLELFVTDDYIEVIKV